VQAVAHEFNIEAVDRCANKKAQYDEVDERGASVDLSDTWKIALDPNA
jgi:hypothetical protein